MIAEYKAAGHKDELQEAIRQLHNSFKMRKPAIHARPFLSGRRLPGRLSARHAPLPAVGQDEPQADSQSHHGLSDPTRKCGNAPPMI